MKSNGFEFLGMPLRTRPRNFVEPAAIEHRMHAALDAFVQCRARRLQADFNRAIPFQRRAAHAVNFGERAARQQAHFNRANHFGAVAGTDAQRGFRDQDAAARDANIAGCVHPRQLRAARAILPSARERPTSLRAIRANTVLCPPSESADANAGANLPKRQRLARGILPR